MRLAHGTAASQDRTFRSRTAACGRLSPGRARSRGACGHREGLAWAAGHAGRREALKACYRGLLPLGERKSIEPIAARLPPHRVEPVWQSLHHLLAQALWSAEAVLAAVQR